MYHGSCCNTAACVWLEYKITEEGTRVVLVLIFLPLVLGWKLLWGVNKQTNKQRSAELCRARAVFLTFPKLWAVAMHLWSSSVRWGCGGRSSPTLSNLSFLTTIVLAPALLVLCVNKTKHENFLKPFRLSLTIISLEMSRIEARSALLINTCF